MKQVFFKNNNVQFIFQFMNLIKRKFASKTFERIDLCPLYPSLPDVTCLIITSLTDHWLN